MSCVLDYSRSLWPCIDVYAFKNLFYSVQTVFSRWSSSSLNLSRILGRKSGNVWKQVCCWSPWEVQFWGELKAWDSGNHPAARPHRHPGFKVAWSLGLHALIGSLRAQYSATAKVTNRPVLGWVMSLGLWKPTGILELKKLCGTESHLVSLSCLGLLEPAKTSDR